MENGASLSSVDIKEEAKPANERTTETMAGFAGSGAVGGGGGGGGGAVGRLVETSQAADRRLIRLVRARRPLYARNNMPVASYYAHCKLLWQEVADHLGCSVAEVRRKWSHIRNSYSRHLRNEVLGARTGRGRSVSRWYLADELAFLRDHMATDTRSPSMSQYSTATLEFADAEVGGPGGGGGGHEGGGGAGGAAGHSPLWAGAAGDALLQPKVEAVYATSEGSVGSGRGGDWEGEGEGGDTEPSLPAFFRPLQGEWAGLSARRRRLFLRQSLALLHALLDEQDAELQQQHHQHQHTILPHQ